VITESRVSKGHVTGFAQIWYFPKEASAGGGIKTAGGLRVLPGLADELREMKQGLWWEFVARVHRRGYFIREIPVRHRPRAAGATRVYQVLKLPGIFGRHLLAVLKIWLQTRNG